MKNIATYLLIHFQCFKSTLRISYRKMELRILFLAFYIPLEVLAFVFSVFGNLVIIYVMTRERKLKRKSNYYIISM